MSEKKEEWSESEWFYIKNIKELKELIEYLPPNTEVKLYSRVLLHVSTNEYSLQFQKHDFS